MFSPPRPKFSANASCELQEAAPPHLRFGNRHPPAHALCACVCGGSTCSARAVEVGHLPRRKRVHGDDASQIRWTVNAFLSDTVDLNAFLSDTVDCECTLCARDCRISPADLPVLDEAPYLGSQQARKDVGHSELRHCQTFPSTSPRSWDRAGEETYGTCDDSGSDAIY